MSRDISEIPGLSGKTLVLFRASGFVNVGSLVEHPVKEIERTLSNTNEEYGIVGWLPSPSAVSAWAATARLLEDAGTEEENGPLTAETIAEVREIAVLVARPVLGVELKEAGVALDAVPIARFVGDPPVSRLGAGAVRHLVAGIIPKKERKERKKDQKQSTNDEMNDGAIRGLSAEINDAPSAKLNEIEEESPMLSEEIQDDAVDDNSEMNFRDTESLAFLNRNSERRNHGMTHKLPKRAYFSAFATFWSMTIGWLTVAVVFSSAIYFALSVGTLPSWILYLVLVIPVCLLLYLTVGLRARCRLCGYRLFVPKACRKHEKAHRSIFGSIYATAFQLISRKSWRCMYCGTKQKLK